MAAVFTTTALQAHRSKHWKNYVKTCVFIVLASYTMENRSRFTNEKQPY
jgi:hypothetical protein